MAKNCVEKLLKQELFTEIMILEICIDNDGGLKSKYEDKLMEHNMKIFALLNENEEKNIHIDSGFDMLVPKNTDLNDVVNNIHTFQCGKINKLDSKVKCRAEMIRLNHKGEIINTPTGFYVYPRSSISKTRIRLANSVGIIDSGYRGNLIGMFDVLENDSNLSKKHVEVECYSRLLQICAPTLCPIVVIMRETKEELGDTTRGSGGFGSTGK